MTDQALRELEQRYRETGTSQDEAAYLRARVRAGQLSEEKLDLAAACGYEAACLARGVPGFLLECNRAWISRTLGGDRDAALRVALPTARRAVEKAWSGYSPAPSGSTDPRTDQRATLESTLDRLEARWVGRGTVRSRSAGALREIAEDRGFTKRDTAQAVLCLLNASSSGGEVKQALEAIHLCRDSLHLRGLEQIALAELVPWALGLRDPLLERVVARDP